MREPMKARLEQLVKEWHEAGRTEFERVTPNLTYDTYRPHTIGEGRKYFYLDENGSGAFIVDKVTGTIWRLKSKYGVPNKRKVCGNVNDPDMTGEKLDRLRWW